MRDNFQRLTSFSLLVMYMAAATPVSELFKLPALLDHYQEHCAEDSNTSIGGFLILHYFSGSPRDADYERDQQLPFKTLEFPPFAFAATHFAPEQLKAPIVPILLTGRQIPASARIYPSAPFLRTPYQPPEGSLFPFA